MGKMYIFSEVRGTVLLKGSPVQGAKVQREFHWTWSKEGGSDETVTDAKGEFSFPEIMRRSLSAMFILHQPVIQQHISITYGGKRYSAWEYTKMDYNRQSETLSMYAKYSPIITMTCQLDKEPERKALGPAKDIFGICEIR